MLLIRALAKAGAAYALATPFMERDGAMIPISTYTDIKCNTPSTTAKNVSVPLDNCVVTVGMESFRLDKIPCSGGGLPSVKAWGFKDTTCSKTYYPTDVSDVCKGSGTTGAAFGAILLTCTDVGTLEQPKPAGTTTITVGSAVPASTGTSGSSGSGSSSASSANASATSLGSSDSGNSPFTLSTTAKAVIGGVAGLLGLLGVGSLLKLWITGNACCNNCCVGGCCGCSRHPSSDRGVGLQQYPSQHDPWNQQRSQANPYPVKPQMLTYNSYHGSAY